MKFGFRTPSLKKKEYRPDPHYEESNHTSVRTQNARGYGWLRDPKKAVYNRYTGKRHSISFDIFSVIKKLFKSK